MPDLSSIEELKRQADEAHRRYLEALEQRKAAIFEIAAKVVKFEITDEELKAAILNARAKAELKALGAKPRTKGAGNEKKRPPVRYRDTDNPENTWSGLGSKQPAWVREKLAAMSRSEFDRQFRVQEA